MSVCLVSRRKFLPDLLSSQLRAFGYIGLIETLDPQALQARIFDHAPSVLFVATCANKWIETIGKFHTAYPSTIVGVLAMDDQDDDFIAWAGIGIAGYIEAETSVEDMASIILRLAAGEIVCPARLADLLLKQFARRPNPVAARAGVNDLTHREQQVVELLAEGLSTKHIARHLEITDATLKNHLHSKLEQLDVRSRGEAAVFYRRLQTGTVATPVTNATAGAGSERGKGLDRLHSRIVKYQAQTVSVTQYRWRSPVRSPPEFVEHRTRLYLRKFVIVQLELASVGCLTTNPVSQADSGLAVNCNCRDQSCDP